MWLPVTSGWISGSRVEEYWVDGMNASYHLTETDPQRGQSVGKCEKYSLSTVRAQDTSTVFNGVHAKVTRLIANKSEKD